ncbi:unnamed protein product [Amoebophrya sp. A25]|nr:unnamed protein product [Amoebophrya sp. A25]|eukprot:GSA25T00000436001.1
MGFDDPDGDLPETGESDTSEKSIIRVPLLMSTTNVTASEPPQYDEAGVDHDAVEPSEEDQDPRKPSTNVAWTTLEHLDNLMGEWLRSIAAEGVETLIDICSDSAADATSVACILGELCEVRFPRSTIFIRRCEQHQLAIAGTRTIEALGQYLGVKIQAAHKRMLREARAMRTHQHICQRVAYARWQRDTILTADIETWKKHQSLWRQFMEDLREDVGLQQALQDTALVPSDELQSLTVEQETRSLIIGVGEKEPIVQAMCRFYRAIPEPKDHRHYFV